MKANLTQIKSIKEIIDWLNSEFPDKFYAILERGEGTNWWMIMCNDYELYTKDEDFRLCREAIREGYADLKVVFCYLRIVNDVKKELRESARWKDTQFVLVK